MHIDTIDLQQQVMIIAELSANHGHSLDVAKETIRAAKRAGADAIKLQTYTADTITLNVKSEDFKISGTIWDGRYLHDLYKEAFTPWEWHQELFDVAKQEGLVCFSSPFDHSAVDLLESLEVPAYKIASFEITDIPLIRLVASTGKPVIISTGIATTEDIELALQTCRGVGNDQIVLLKCTSSYPAPIEEANLQMIPDFRERFKVIPGLSDHTMGAVVPIAATALGARVIEKHFILDKEIGGPDSSFSMDEVEFKEMVTAVRAAESALGVVDYHLTASQEKGRVFRRSLYVAEDIKKGELLTDKNIRSVRPGFGMHPRHYQEMLGSRAKQDMKKGDRLQIEDVIPKD